MPKLSKKKTNKKNNKPSVVSKLRKLSLKNKAFLSMAAFLFLTTVGYSAFAVIRSNQLKAQAENWTILYVDRDLHRAGVTSARACKTYINAYGGVYNVKVQVWRKSNSVYSIHGTSWRYQDQRWLGLDRFEQKNWLYGVVAGEDLNASVYLKDKIELGVWINGRREGRFIRPYGVPNSEMSRWDPKLLKDC